MAGRSLPRSDLAIAAVLFVAATAFNHSVMTYSTGIMESHHGRFHSAYIYQIYNGIIPPTNVHAAGEPTNFYWPWHLGLAGIMKITGLAPLQVNAWVGSVAFGTTFLALYLLARRLGMTIGFGLCLPLFALGMHRLLPFILLQLGFDFVHGWPPRPTATADKFLNFSSFPTAFAAFALAFYWELSSRWRGEGLTPFYWLCVLAMGFFSPIVLFTYDLWLALLLATQFQPSMSWGDARDTCRREFLRYWPILLCHLAIAPFLLRVSSLMGGSTTATLDPSVLAKDLVRIQPTLWIFALAFGAGLYLHYRRFRDDDSRRTRWLVWSPPFGLMLYPLLQLPDGNEYKLVLLWSLPLGLAIVLAANELVRDRGRLVYVGVLTLLIACGSGSILANAVSRTNHRLGRSDPWTFRGVSTDWKQRGGDRQLAQEMVDWIRANTAVTDYLLVPSERWDRSLFPLLTQRRIVAALPSIHTAKLENHPRLFDLNRRLLARISARRQWLTGDWDRLTKGLYEIVGDGHAFFAVVRKDPLGPWPSHPSLVYQSARYAVLTPSSRPSADTTQPADQIPLEIQGPTVVP